jgi:HEAT repeat protein
MSLWKRLGPFCVLLFAIGCSKSTGYWTAQAKSDDPSQRLHAIHALEGRVNDREVIVPVLIEALKDDNTYVRRDAARALGHFGGEAREAVPSLQARLRDKEPSVRKAAAGALQQIDPAALPKARAKSR